MKTIIVRQRPDDYIAHIKDDSCAWARGRTRAEAVGKLIIDNEFKIGLVISNE